MDLSPVLVFLRQKIGLNPESIGVLTVEKAVREHVLSTGIASIGEYVDRLNESPESLKDLIESIVIPETSFFRNKIPFKTLQSYLKKFVLDNLRKQAVRILCFPCATGEEAYSIAMTLMKMGLPPKQFSVFAGDISDHSLEIAKAGIYGSYSFRGENLDYRDKYFAKREDGTYLLNKEVRDTVSFGQENILADDFLSGHRPYDIIFCRNLLIYFDDTAKEKAINNLSRLLTEKGVLFVGHAEGSSVPRFGYVPLDYTMSFAFAKKEYAMFVNNTLHAATPPLKPLTLFDSVPPAVRIAALLNEPAKFVPVTTPLDKSSKSTVAEKASSAESDIVKARKLANEGSYQQVVEICEGLLSGGLESAEVYFLLGQVAGSSGDSLLAEEYLKKAIYLDADYYDALIYFSLLMEKRGNPEKAATLRKRAKRVEVRNAGGIQK